MGEATSYGAPPFDLINAKRPVEILKELKFISIKEIVVVDEG